MFRRLVILTVILIVSLVAVAVLGLHALTKWQQGLAGARLGEFARTAEAIRADVSQTLDVFLQQEEARSYSDYLYYHVAGGAGGRGLNLRSPLGGRLDHGLAYGHFQIEADGTILTPNDDILQHEGASAFNQAIEQASEEVRSEVKNEVLSQLQAESSRADLDMPAQDLSDSQALWENLQQQQAAPALSVQRRVAKEMPKAKALPIDSLNKRSQQTQFVQQDRNLVMSNTMAAEDQ
ncbi:hypothetical protein ACFL3F_03265, partial [Planctomycetota bacterium]